jgi:hypothetical protein
LIETGKLEIPAEVSDKLKKSLTNPPLSIEIKG